MSATVIFGGHVSGKGGGKCPARVMYKRHYDFISITYKILILPPSAEP